MTAHQQRRALFGLDFDDVTLKQARDRIDAWVVERPEHTRLVFCANVASLFLWRQSPEIQQIYRDVDLLTVDGMGLVYAGKLMRTPLRGSVSGSTLFESVLANASGSDLRVFLLGATSEVVAEVARRLPGRYPGVVVVGAHDGYFGPEQETRIVRDIRASRADLLLLGMSSPLKESFAWRHRDRLGVPVAIGVGGMFDIAAGLRRRAPRPVQLLCLEWLWRLAQEPRRLGGRYLRTNTAFLRLLAGEILRGEAKPRIRRLALRGHGHD